MKNWLLNFFIRKLITLRESELKTAQSSFNHAKEKESAALESGNEYSFGYWFGLKSCYEDEVRRINREIDFLNSELKESEQSVS